VLVGLEPGTGRVISGQDHLPGGFEHWMTKRGIGHSPPPTTSCSRRDPAASTP
jgi:hypothetical protein